MVGQILEWLDSHIGVEVKVKDTVPPYQRQIGTQEITGCHSHYLKTHRLAQKNQRLQQDHSQSGQINT